MDTIIYLIIAVGILFLYIMLSIAVFDKYSRSKGINKIFWFLIMLGTLSFIFGSDSSYSSSYTNDYGGEDQDEWNNSCFFNDEYDNDWSSNNENCSFDYDDWNSDGD